MTPQPTHLTPLLRTLRQLARTPTNEAFYHSALQIAAESPRHPPTCGRARTVWL
jgi:hypothetical protein